MNGKNNICFNLPLDTTISDLIEKIKEKEGPQVADIHLIKSGKPIRVVSADGKKMTLADYDMYDNCTLFASLRLIGGAQQEGVVARSFDIKKVIKLGASLAKANNNITYKNCIINLSEGCTESTIPKAKLSCGCIYCADCMKTNIDNQIEIGGKVDVNCGNTSHGDYKLDIFLSYAIAALSNDEKKEKDEILNKNYISRPDSIMSVCPNANCQRFVNKDDYTTKVQCTACQKYMCWFCKKEYKNIQSSVCGNEDCDIIACINAIIELGQFKTIDDRKVFDTRFCPNINCTAVNGHASQCRKVQCPSCKVIYCHFCLGIWDKDCNYGKKCNIAPKQVVTKDMLPK